MLAKDYQSTFGTMGELRKSLPVSCGEQSNEDKNFKVRLGLEHQVAGRIHTYFT